ncbi:MAG: adenylate/guanylate cyclase domain-containing protein, partial [Chitinophagaceae bacterium]
HHFTTDDSARVIIFLLSGVAAGMVAKQIRDGVSSSLKEAERRHKVENLFGQQISAEVAEKILESNGEIETRRMKVAVMFIDIRNFTNFAAESSPEEVVKYQNAFFGIVINAVTKHEGVVHQFLGDGCMITFGAPVSLDNPSERAVNTAYEILRQLERAGMEGTIKPTRIGIGIHTGEAVTGNIGTSVRQQYSVTGTVVITAARIEQLNKKYESVLLVSEDVVRNIDGHPAAKHLGEQQLKGLPGSLSVYKLV